MRNASINKVGIKVFVTLVITLIINLSCPITTWAQDTNKPAGTLTTESTAYCLPAVQGALGQAFGFNPPVTTVTPAQASFVKQYFATRMQLDWSNKLRKDGVLDYMSGPSNKVQNWLATKGFKMNLGSGDAVASVFDVKLDWVTPGQPTSMMVDKVAYSAAKFTIGKLEDKSADNGRYAAFKPEKEVKGFTGPHFYLPVTKKGWTVSIMEYIGEGNELALIQACRTLKETAQAVDESFTAGTVTIPKVSMMKEVDVSVLMNMSGEKDGKKFRVDQAIKVCKFDLSDTGVKASAAVALVSKGPAPRSHIIDGPFAVMIWDSSGIYPAFVALCASDSWVKESK
ncbi:MAG: hypothetical protein RIQ72_63 [Candidatus Parcubacteria bacterium]|jgi:hypothetical protein